jgi:ABC-type nitrate/sulfonate/bicarbonate transport system permease component
MAAVAGTLSPRRAYVRHEPVVLGVLGLVLFVGLWEVAGGLGWINPVLLSRPSQVVAAVGRQWTSGELPRDLQVTVGEILASFVVASVVGITLGIAMGLNRTVEYALDPFVWFFYSAPLVAFYPLLVIWLGFGFWTVLAIGVFLAFVPIAVNTLAGARGVDPVLIRAVRAFGGSRREVIQKVILPGALPLILAGLRIGVGRTLIGVLLGELFSANAGLGYRMTIYGARLRTTDVLVPLVAITIIGVAATQGLRLLEHRLSRWRQA